MPWGITQRGRESITRFRLPTPLFFPTRLKDYRTRFWVLYSDRVAVFFLNSKLSFFQQQITAIIRAIISDLLIRKASIVSSADLGYSIRQTNNELVQPNLQKLITAGCVVFVCSWLVLHLSGPRS